MSTVICNRENCKFRSGTMCTKPFITLHAAGACSEWFDKNGQARPAPYYSTIDGPYPTVPQATPHFNETEQKMAKDEKNGTFEEKSESTENAENHEMEESKNDLDGNGRDVSNNSELSEESMGDNSKEQKEAGN